LLFKSIHLHWEIGVQFCCLVFLGEVELAGKALTQGLELGQVRADLLRETALRRNGCGPVVLLVLRAGILRGGNLTPFECLLEAVEMRKKEFAVVVVLGACVLRLRVCASVGSKARRLRGLCCCRLISAVVVLKEVLALKGGGQPRWRDPGGILEVVYQQPDLLSRLVQAHVDPRFGLVGSMPCNRL
jgi:hypothetical protein